MCTDAEKRANEGGSSAVTYVVVLPPPFNQLLRYHISETKQETGRCGLRKHWLSDECGTIKTRRFVWPRFSTSNVTTHLYARRREAMVVEEEVAASTQSRSATFAFGPEGVVELDLTLPQQPHRQRFVFMSSFD